MNTIIKNKSAILIGLLVVAVIIAGNLVNCLSAKNIYTYDTQELRISRYWQGLKSSYWANWFVDYYKNIYDKHDAMYKSTQRSRKGRYFKSGVIKYRPAIIWFAYPDGTTSWPRVIKSSGSKTYDDFNIRVIRSSKIPNFPSACKRVFMFDGEISDVLLYLKNKGVIPKTYTLKQSISPAQIKWENL